MNSPLVILEREHALKAEQSVLGSVFFENKVMDEILTSIDVSDFYSERHSLIFRAFKYLHEKSKPIDPNTIVEALVKRKQLDDAGGVKYLYELAQSVPSASQVSHYVEIVKNYSLQRKGLRLAEDIAKISNEMVFENHEEFHAAIDSLVMQLRPKITGSIKSSAETEPDYEESLDSKDDFIKTGFNTFDEKIGGIGRGWLYILAGRPSVGKTAKALQMSYQMAKQNIGDVLFWSQEMKFNQLKNRLFSNLSGIPFGRIRKRELDEREKEMLMNAHRHLSQYPFYVDDSSGVTIDHIRATARQFLRKNGRIGAIFVDYLTRMDIKAAKGETWSRSVGEVAKRFKWLAQELDAPIILLAQLNRTAETNNDTPGLHHLRDSGEIEQEADMVEILWREKEQNETNGIIVNSTIAKGRDTGTIDLQYRFKGWIQRYEEMEATSLAPNSDGYITNHRPNRRRNGSA